MAPLTTKARLSLHAEASRYIRHINNSAIVENCMLESSLSTPRKCARSEQYRDQQSEALLSTKRRKTSPSSEPPPAFWDNLSKIWLTRGALKELDRRNSQASQSAHSPEHKQLIVTRKQERVEALCSHDPSSFKDVESFARHGGPDLSDLRSVRLQYHTIFLRR